MLVLAREFFTHTHICSEIADSDVLHDARPDRFPKTNKFTFEIWHFLLHTHTHSLNLINLLFFFFVDSVGFAFLAAASELYINGETRAEENE